MLMTCARVACVEAITRATGVGSWSIPRTRERILTPSLFATELLRGASRRIGGRFASLDLEAQPQGYKVARSQMHGDALPHCLALCGSKLCGRQRRPQHNA